MRRYLVDFMPSPRSTPRAEERQRPTAYHLVRHALAVTDGLRHVERTEPRGAPPACSLQDAEGEDDERTNARPSDLHVVQSNTLETGSAATRHSLKNDPSTRTRACLS